MNSYTFYDIGTGFEENFKVAITEDMVCRFLNVSGDENPLHIDAEYAKSKGFHDKVVYGMLGAVFYSTLVGVYLPGEHCILQSIIVSFHHPIFVGDRLTVSGKVTDKCEAVHSIKISAKVVNQEGKKVSKASIMVGFLDETSKGHNA